MSRAGRISAEEGGRQRVLMCNISVFASIKWDISNFSHLMVSPVSQQHVRPRRWDFSTRPVRSTGARTAEGDSRFSPPLQWNGSPNKLFAGCCWPWKINRCERSNYPPPSLTPVRRRDGSRTRGSIPGGSGPASQKASVAALQERASENMTPKLHPFPNARHFCYKEQHLATVYRWAQLFCQCLPWTYKIPVL